MASVITGVITHGLTVTGKHLFGIARARLIKSDFSNTSTLVSYYLLLALFPLIILLGNLLPYVAVSATTVLNYLRYAFPDPVWSMVGPTIEKLLTTPNPGLFLASLTAFIGAAAKAVQQLYNGLIKTYGITKHRGFWASKVVTILSILAILASLLAFVLLFVFGEMLMSAVSSAAPWLSPVTSALWDARGFIAILFLFALLCILYLVLPHGTLKIREVWPGAACATIGLVLLSDGFAIYVHFAANSLAIYGAISIFFVLMIWLNFSTTLLMAGTLVNATLRQYHKGTSSDDTASEGEGEGEPSKGKEGGGKGEPKDTKRGHRTRKTR